MSPSPFDPSFDELPATLPVFPLPGVLLLPKGKLPLNIFEPRYLNMTRDALATDRLIGMIQPKPTELGRDAGARCLYRIGCAGRITQFAETDDGRFLITLTGVCRFAVDEELASMRGYRRVIADWGPFSRDLAGDCEAELDRSLLVNRLKRYFDAQGITADWGVIEQTPDDRLVTTLAMVCPFESSEKQALLECDSLKARASMMLALLDMAVADTSGGDHARH
ncbi:LON peptidase substrate-binding domain-containing protein [Thalassobaculum sp. OXR-137]|uniref:LON peptidase substrate-binding domain-containing protein n=1 Tax=Thalassobaculum sp. OXR-137 TaxID=3100173 RepID=UPI002AC8D74C|nr:LON peptidase substrate-binding domain-containing protein [Thalassobaculum sp. OXR-137]WPZ35375.1 LON peptidase substrate-binding domain-containing protein [Thalassobaculum sp. OXR-137]